MNEARMKAMHTHLLAGLACCLLALLGGCSGVNTFPAIARPGDTVSLMAGGSAKANKQNVSAVLTDAGGQVFDLQALGLVRSVFNLRADGRAYGMHYSPYLDSVISWAIGHEPLQTVLVTDLPANAMPGQATLRLTLNVDDNSSGTGAYPHDVVFEIVAGTGHSEIFPRSTLSGQQPVDFGQMETAPHARVSFGNAYDRIGAAALVIDFDETVVTPGDLSLYAPETNVRQDGEPFGGRQRMLYWRQDGDRLYVDIIAPQGIEPFYLQFSVLHPRGLSGSPAFHLESAQVYDLDGNAVALQPVLTYFP
jgi:hypothetical protein